MGSGCPSTCAEIFSASSGLSAHIQSVWPLRDQVLLSAESLIGLGRLPTFAWLGMEAIETPL
jgi:hypothetical protein